jgi:hypothetical protein
LSGLIRIASGGFALGNRHFIAKSAQSVLIVLVAIDFAWPAIQHRQTLKNVQGFAMAEAAKSCPVKRRSQNSK